MSLTCQKGNAFEIHQSKSLNLSVSQSITTINAKREYKNKKQERHQYVRWQCISDACSTTLSVVDALSMYNSAHC